MPGRAGEHACRRLAIVVVMDRMTAAFNGENSESESQPEAGEMPTAQRHRSDEFLERPSVHRAEHTTEAAAPDSDRVMAPVGNSFLSTSRDRLGIIHGRGDQPGHLP
jgi:hypothetical protein